MQETKLKTTRIIAISVAAILTSIIILVASNFYFLNTNNENLELIESFHNRKLDIISRMTHIVRERSLVMLAMYVEDDEWKIDEQFMKFNSLAAEFIRLRDQLKVLGLTNKERNELEKALSVIRKTEPLQVDIVEKIRSGDYEGLQAEISVKDLPLEFKLLDVFNTLTKNVRDEALSAKKQAQHIHRRSLFIVATVSVTITFLIMLLMYRSLKKIQIIERNLIEETTSLSWDATHDSLTNIHNRRWLEHKIEQLGKRESDKNSINSIIYLDLDDFKIINDRYGHAAGDQYLIAFCREIEHCIRQNDIFARLGGDEFVVLLDNCDLKNAIELATDMLKRIQSLSIVFNGNTLSANCSIGLLEFSVASENIKDVLHRADAHCYTAKRQGKNKIYSGVPI